MKVLIVMIGMNEKVLVDGISNMIIKYDLKNVRVYNEN